MDHNWKQCLYEQELNLVGYPLCSHTLPECLWQEAADWRDYEAMLFSFGVFFPSFLNKACTLFHQDGLISRLTGVKNAFAIF